MSGEMGSWIFDTMVSMTLLMAVVLLLRRPVSHLFGPKIAYLLWALPLARLFMPPLTVETPASAEAALTPILASEFAVAASAEQAAASAFASIDWMLIGIIVWLGGAGMLFISKLAAYMQFREDIISDGQLVGRHGNIKILETAAVGGPLAFGLFDKYIAVPADFFRSFAPRERELALDHEIAHHEAGDLAANFVGLLILSLHWFNPVAWFSWIAFRQDQETACDARILGQGGRNLRAVYGRTIAKSASGHKLGLASPLNQKDKIKGRLKMLGQDEKSPFRRYLGIALVAGGTAISLPLTATVVYAEADVAEVAHDPAVTPDEKEHVEKEVKIIVDKDGEKKKTVKIRKYKGKSGDPSAIEVQPGDSDHVRKIEKDGKTIIVRTDKPISDEEFDRMIADAEKSHREAMKDLREHEKDMEKHEYRIEKRELKRELEEARREIHREMHEARREAQHAKREAAEVRQEAIEAVRESRLETVPDGRDTVKISAISFGSKSPSDCRAMGRTIAFGGKPGAAKDRAWAAVAGCSEMQIKIDRTALLEMTLRTLKEQREKMAKSCNNPNAKMRRDLRNFDRQIEHIEAKLHKT